MGGIESLILPTENKHEKLLEKLNVVNSLVQELCMMTVPHSKFIGFVKWEQNYSLQTLQQQEEAMTTACAKNFPPGRPLTAQEYIDNLVALPYKNTSDHYLTFTGKGCTPSNYDSVKNLVKVALNGVSPDSQLNGKFDNEDLAQGIRTVICVSDT